jgi:hypothetical protein
VIFARVFVLVVRPCGAEVFVFVEVFQFVGQEFINDAPNIFRLIGQDVCHATIAPGGLQRKCQPVRGQFRAANKLCQGASLFHLRPIKV